MTSGQYAWARVTEQGWTRNLRIPLRLEANTTYYVLSYESADAYYNLCPVTPSAGITVTCGATAAGSQYGISGAFVDGATPNTAYGPVNFTFLDTAVGNMGFPCDAPDGVQAAFIGDTGAISQDVVFPKTGNFALLFNAAAGGANGSNAVNFYFDGVKCTPLGGDNPLWLVSSTAWTPGGFERRTDDLAIQWGCTVFPVTTTGTHTISVQGTGSAGKYLYLDNIQIVSEEALFGPGCSHFPAMGQANGQNPMGGLNAFVNTLHGENNWAASWGLRTMAYEGGWSVGGDFDQKPFHSYCKYISPLSVIANSKGVNVFTRGGGNLFCYYYSQWPDGYDDNATSYSLVKSVIQFNDHLPAEANWGALLPADLDATNSTLWAASNADSAGNLSAQGAWISWNIISPVTDTYELVSTVSGAGGSYVLLVNDAIQVAAGTTDADLRGSIFLTKGQHTVKVRSTGSAAIAVKNIAVNLLGGPATPALIGADFGNTSCTLNWTGVAGAAGYTLYYGTTSGNYAFSSVAGNVTSTTLTGLDGATVYYAAVQAFNAAHRLSLLSNEIRFARRSSDPEALIDFEDQAVTGTALPELRTKSYRFTGFGNLSQVQVHGPTGGSNTWPSKVLMTTSWGTSHRMEREDQTPFDLYSFDLGSYYGGQSAIITAYDPSGASFRKIVNFPNTPSGQIFVLPLVLDWIRIARLEIKWCNKPDGASTQDRFGAIDNLLVNRGTLPVGAPVFGPPGGTYATTQTVTVACATANAEIRYTTDNSAPTTTSTLYTAPLAIGVNTTLRAQARKAGLPDSAVTSATYTIVRPAHAPAWLSNPFSTANATNGVTYTASVAPNATDPNPADVLTFSKISGPAWLSLAPDGALTGTPQSIDLGVGYFTIGVTDSLGASAYAVLRVQVAEPTPPPPPAWILIH